MLLVYSAHMLFGHFHFLPLPSVMLGCWFHSWLVNQLQLSFPFFFEMSVSYWFPRIYVEMVDPCPSMKFVWNPLMLIKIFRVFLAGNGTTQSLFFSFQDKKISSLPVLEVKLTYVDIFPWKKRLPTISFSVLDWTGPGSQEQYPD